ncbi:MAG: hypothetical protein QM636_01855, partial [Rhizobium sp.]
SIVAVTTETGRISALFLNPIGALKSTMGARQQAHSQHTQGKNSDAISSTSPVANDLATFAL